MEERERMYSRRQVADQLGKHYTTIRRWEAEGRIEVAAYDESGGHREPRFTQGEVDRLRDVLETQDSIVTTMERDRELEEELYALRRENGILRDDLERERSLVDRLLQIQRPDAEILRAKERMLTQDR